jgi:hypothetical protein
MNALTFSLAQVHGQSEGADLAQLLSTLFSTPASVAVFIIEFSLGVGLGYVAFKALKYLIVFAIIIFLGTMLSVWIAPSVSVNWALIMQRLIEFAYSLGFLTMLPVTLGLIVGAAIAITR